MLSPLPSLLTIADSVCAIHGLGGNGFDTWMGTTKMWLKDLLPQSTPFNTSRIMTFGYNSAMFDKKSNDRMRDWADELLRQIGYVRVSDEEQKRPIILICHSLVGSSQHIQGGRQSNLASGWPGRP